jgi:aryl-alcohol dehydrogenase-like predicted oxidoreductase
VPASLHFGLGILPYFPLANGMLTGKIRRGQEPREGTRLHERVGYITEDKLDKVEALAQWAEQHGRSLLEVGIGALAALPGCTSVIAGATSPEQMRANAAAADWIPAPEELAEIDKIVPCPS